MIISKTPFRVSFVGGGSDLRAYYLNNPGAVVSTTISKHMYVTVNKRFDNTIRVSYTKTEIVENLKELQHELIRESMRLSDIKKGIEITTIADIPAGTGLGSSSSLTVGLLNALYSFKGKFRSAERLANDASKIELDILNKPMGKQDQYSAAYGGINYIQFNPDESVYIEPITCLRKTKEQLNKNLLTFYIGIRGKNNALLAEQKEAIESQDEKKDTLKKMVALAQDMKDKLNQNDLTSFGELLNKNWILKKSLTKGISNEYIQKIYEKGLGAGAVGGKILGAGGNGFMLFYCEEEKQKRLKEIMKSIGIEEFKFNLDPQGSRIIYAERTF